MVRDIGARHFRIKRPQDFAVSGIERIGNAPLAGGIDHPARDEWSRFQAPCRAQFSTPDEAEPANVLLIDLAQGAEPLLVGGSSVHRPIGPVIDGGRSGFLATHNGDGQRANQEKRDAAVHTVGD